MVRRRKPTARTPETRREAVDYRIFLTWYQGPVDPQNPPTEVTRADFDLFVEHSEAEYAQLGADITYYKMGMDMLWDGMTKGTESSDVLTWDTFQGLQEKKRAQAEVDPEVINGPIRDFIGFVNNGDPEANVSMEAYLAVRRAERMIIKFGSHQVDDSVGSSDNWKARFGDRTEVSAAEMVQWNWDHVMGDTDVELFGGDRNFVPA